MKSVIKLNLEPLNLKMTIKGGISSQIVDLDLLNLKSNIYNHVLLNRLSFLRSPDAEKRDFLENILYVFTITK